MTDDRPGLQVLRRHPARRRLRPAGLLAALAVAVVGLVATGWAVAARQPTAVQGAGLLVAVVALANGVWQLGAAVDRVELAEARRTAGTAATTIGRRPLLARALVAAAGLLGLGGLAALVRYGPRAGSPGQAWAAGTRLVTETGQPLRPDDIPVGGFTTAWPEQGARPEVAAVMVLRLTLDPMSPTMLDWVVDGRLLAYSKVCSHAGCPVGLFRETDNALHCPCHHAEFDALRGATPIAGPAWRPLPQLPLGVDGDGFLIATGPFQEPVVPAPITKARG